MGISSGIFLSELVHAQAYFENRIQALENASQFSKSIRQGSICQIQCQTTLFIGFLNKIHPRGFTVANMQSQNHLGKQDLL